MQSVYIGLLSFTKFPRYLIIKNVQNHGTTFHKSPHKHDLGRSVSNKERHLESPEEFGGWVPLRTNLRYLDCGLQQSLVNLQVSQVSQGKDSAFSCSSIHAPTCPSLFMVRSAVTPHFAVRRVISRHLLGKIKLLESELIPNSWVSQTQVHLETTGPNTKEL